MVKTAIKIAIAGVVILGCFNVARELMNEYRFEDKVHDALLFDARMTDQEIVKMVMEIAGEYGIPIEPSGIDIANVGQDIRVNMTYTTDVVIIPGVVSYPWTFSPSASTRILVGKRR